MTAASIRTARLRELRQQLLKSQHTAVVSQTIETGLSSLDTILPNGGFSTSSVVEWISDQPGTLAGTTALRCARPLLQLSGCLAVIDGHHEFHASAAESTGIPLSRMLLIRPSDPAETLWALEQTALSAGVRVVLCWLDRVSSTVMRRLQLAVEKSGVTIFLIRPAQVLKQPSWADVRLLIRMEKESGSQQPGSRTIAVDLIRSRHSVQQTGRALLKIDHETGVMHSVCRLADSATAATVKR